MIYFDSPEKFVSQKPVAPYASRVIIVLLFAMFVLLLAWSAFLIFRPWRVETLKEEQMYRFGDYSVTLEKITDTFCPGGEDQNCTVWLKELGVQFRYTSKEQPGITFAYLGLNSQRELVLPQMKIELLEINFPERKAELKFIQLKD
ncbi:MAG: hypothetical protein HY397_00355 [Candidatus Doudnabacteria bacterium]|nr:hypothetical protein [Candidatus Doudnabacteria bacterium]